MKYLVDYGTGAGNFETETLEEAEKKAVEEMSYTQENVRIFENGKQIKISYWRNGKKTEDENSLADFGCGYYSEWYDCE